MMSQIKMWWETSDIVLYILYERTYVHVYVLLLRNDCVDEDIVIEYYKVVHT